MNSIVFSQNDTLFEIDFLKNKRKVLLTLNELNENFKIDSGKELTRFPIVEFYENDK